MSLRFCICRGGGEFGIDWRNQGSKGYKQNVFNDFQACAEHLISAGYTNPSKLTIQVIINLCDACIVTVVMITHALPSAQEGSLSICTLHFRPQHSI